MIITSCGHVLYTKMLHFAWQSVSAILRNRGGGGGGGIPTAHMHVLMRDCLPVVQAACGVRRHWSLQRTFPTVETVLRHSGMLQSSNED